MSIAAGIVLISHCVLPLLAQHDFFPFFDWNLFTNFPRPAQYAEVLISKTPGHIELLAHSGTTDRVWNLIQSVYRRTENAQVLIETLAPERNGDKMIEIAPIEDILAQYVQRSHAEALQKLGSRTPLYRAQ